MIEHSHDAPFTPNHDTQLIDYKTGVNATALHWLKSKLSGFSVSVQKVSSSHADTTMVFLKVPPSGLQFFYF